MTNLEINTDVMNEVFNFPMMAVKRVTIDKLVLTVRVAHTRRVRRGLTRRVAARSGPACCDCASDPSSCTWARL